MFDIFELETMDFVRTKGDTIYLHFEVKDRNGNPINITSFYCKFTLKDPITHQYLINYQKIHNDFIVGGGGIYYFGDQAVGIPQGLNLSANNQLVVYIPYDEAALLDKEIYPFDIEFTVNNLTAKITPIHGNLILREEKTPSV